MITEFFRRLKDVWVVTLFGIISPILLIYCAWNLTDVIKIGYLGKTVNAPIFSKVEKTCTSGGGRKRRNRESYTCYDYSIKISKNFIVNFTESTNHNLGDKISITVLENQPEIYRMGEKNNENHEYLLKSPEFWMSTIGLLLSVVIFFKIYIKGSIYLIKLILSNSFTEIKNYIFPIIITYAIIGYIVSFSMITWGEVLHFLHTLMRF